MSAESIDRSFRWEGATGLATPDGLPMTPATPYFIASIDKLLTATIVFKLYERGLITLDESISAYLPGTLIGGIHRLNGTDHTDRITVRHLLGHTSGLPDWLEDSPRGGRSMVELLVEEGDRSVSLDELIRIVRDELTPHFEPRPGTAKRQQVRYCDTNFILLIAIIEATTGQPLHQIHEQLLFQPLNLRHTWVAGHSEPMDPTTEPATFWADDGPIQIPLMMRSFWGVYSTLEDCLRFMRGFSAGAVFEEPETLELMQQCWNRFGIPLDRAALRSPQWPIEYGLGIMRFQDPLLRFLSRLPRSIRPTSSSHAVIGHTGSTGSWLFHCPRLDLLLAGTVDQASAGSVPFRVVPKILGIVEASRRT